MSGGDRLFQDAGQIVAFAICAITLIIIFYLAIRACLLKRQRNMELDRNRLVTRQSEQRILLSPGLNLEKRKMMLKRSSCRESTGVDFEVINLSEKSTSTRPESHQPYIDLGTQPYDRTGNFVKMVSSPSFQQIPQVGDISYLNDQSLSTEQPRETTIGNILKHCNEDHL